MRWFILRVAGRKAQGIVETIGEAAWWPTTTRWTKPARKKKPVQTIVPLIPGWIFVKEDNYGMWNHLEGVYGVLKYGNHGPLFVEDEELDGLRSACHNPNPLLKPDLSGWTPVVGDRVRLRGLLYGRIGTIIADLGKGLFKVEVGWVRTEIHVQLMEPYLG